MAVEMWVEHENGLRIGTRAGPSKAAGLLVRLGNGEDSIYVRLESLDC
jgi:hypothetical protein